jgi:hypothetical protein
MLPGTELSVAYALASVGQPDKLGEMPIPIRTYYQIDPRNFSEQRGTQPLRHASHHAEYPTGPLVPLKLPYSSDDPLLRIVADGTGVHQHDVCVLRILGPHVALAAENSEHQLGVGHIHLATIGLDVDALHDRQL